MKPIVRMLAVILGLLVVLVAGLFAYLKFAFDPNDYRDRLAAMVKAQTGRELQLEGDLRLSVFPWLGVELGAARLGNASGFSEAPFASIRSAQVRARLLPLIRGELEVDRITLDGLSLSLERGPDGAANWDDLVPQGEDAPAQVPEPPAPAASSGPPISALVLGGLELRDAKLSWDDRQAGVHHELSGIDLSTGKLEPGKAFPLKVSAALSSTAPQLTARIQLGGEATLDLAEQRHQIRDLRLEITAEGGGVPGGKAVIDLGANLLADLGAGTARIDALQLGAYGLRLTGAIDVSGLNALPQLSGSLALAEFSPRALAQAMGVALPPSADAAVLTRLKLTASLGASAKGAALSDLVIALDDSQLRGKAGVDNFAHPDLSFDLELDGIDVDRYLPPGSPVAAAEPAPPVAAEPAIAPAIPESLALSGELRIGKLKASGLHFSAIRLPVSVEDGRAVLRPEAALYGGSYRGNIHLDGRGKSIGVRVDEQLAGVQIGPLTRDLTGQPEKITGTADISAQLMTSGSDAAGFKRNLNGSAALRFADGAVKGVNIAAYLRQAEAKLTGKPVPDDEGPNQTDFTDFVATVKITDGVVRNDDLSLRSPLLRVGGAGSADLNTEAIDYLVRATVVGTLTGQGGKSLDRVKGVTVPVKVSGTFEKPAYALDTESLLSDSVKEKVKEKTREIREKAKDRLKEQLQKGLGGFLR